jgi:hypothetical protein
MAEVELFKPCTAGQQQVYMNIPKRCTVALAIRLPLRRKNNISYYE